jgi:hypothetical protein
MLKLDQHIFEQIFAWPSAGSLNISLRQAPDISTQGNAILEYRHSPHVNRVDGPQFQGPTIERELPSQERPRIHETPPSAQVAGFRDSYRIGAVCTRDIFECRLLKSDARAERRV